MHCVFRDDHIAVYDDFLPPPDFRAVWAFVQAQRYYSVHADGWDPVWGLHEGEPRASAVIFSGPGAALEAAREREPDAVFHVHPTGTHVDRLIQQVVLHAPDFASLVGRQGEDWELFTARAFLYPMQTSLRWHTDHGPFTGAFTFFAHPHWNSAWGGELQVADLPEGASAAGCGGSALDNRAESELLLARGMGRFLMPRPNRLVVIRAGTPHAINHVHVSAGASARCSVAGFFMRRGDGDGTR